MSKDCLNLRRYKVNTTAWEIVAEDESLWCASIPEGTKQIETDHISQAKQKRQQRKDRLLHLPDSLTAATHTCPTCHCTFQAQIGIIDHRRVHNKVAANIATNGQPRRTYLHIHNPNTQHCMPFSIRRVAVFVGGEVLLNRSLKTHLNT